LGERPATLSSFQEFLNRLYDDREHWGYPWRKNVFHLGQFGTTRSEASNLHCKRHGLLKLTSASPLDKIAVVQFANDEKKAAERRYRYDYQRTRRPIGDSYLQSIIHKAAQKIAQRILTVQAQSIETDGDGDGDLNKNYAILIEESERSITEKLDKKNWRPVLNRSYWILPKLVDVQYGTN